MDRAEVLQGVRRMRCEGLLERHQRGELSQEEIGRTNMIARTLAHISDPGNAVAHYYRRFHRYPTFPTPPNHLLMPGRRLIERLAESGPDAARLAEAITDTLGKDRLGDPPRGIGAVRRPRHGLRGRLGCKIFTYQ